jgi:signal transduction histidine kinase
VSQPSSPFEQTLPPWLVGLGVAAGAAIATASWVERHARPAVAVGFAVTAMALFVPTWAAWSWLPATVQAWVLAVAPLAVAGAAQVGMRWSSERPNLPTLRVVWGLTIAAALVHVAGYDPLADPGCVRTCAEARALAAELVSTPTSLMVVTALIAAAGAVAAFGLAPAVVAGRSRAIAIASLLAVVLLVEPWVARTGASLSPQSPIDQILPGVLAGLILGAAPVVAGIRMQRTRVEMQRLVDQLGNPGSAGDAALDPPWRIEFALPGEDRWIDAAGDVVAPQAASHRSVAVSDATGPVLRLQLAPGDEPSEVLAALTPAAMLALRNARLAAVRRAQLAEVRASQRRIVAASDAERERIERDLHDGAQQRLVSAAFHISLAQNRLQIAEGAQGETTLADADGAVHEALAKLRTLGHGIFPAVLTAEGLGAALEDLVRGGEVPTTLDVPDLDLGRDVGAAAYAVAAAALEAAGRRGSSATVSASVDDGWLRLIVRLSGDASLTHADLVDVADRVGALGGHLDLERVDGGVQVRTEVPCA